MTAVTPAAYVVTDAEPQTDDWFKARRDGITGTDIPKILGMSKRGTALHVYYDKLGELPAEPESRYALWERRLEDPIARGWAEDHATSVSPVGILAHVEEPWMRASLDRLVDACPDGDGPCGLEVKNRSAFVRDGWADDRVPDDVLAQVVWGAVVAGFRHMHVAGLFGGNEPVYARVDLDPDDIEWVTAAAREVWERVEQQVPPTVDPAPLLVRLLNQRTPDREGDREVTFTEAEDWTARYRLGRALEKRGKAVRESAHARLVVAMGTGDRLRTADGETVATYYASTRGVRTLRLTGDYDRSTA